MQGHAPVLLLNIGKDTQTFRSGWAVCTCTNA
jgi:hypothetical protein